MSRDSRKKEHGKIMQINEQQIKDHLGKMVQGTVEEILIIDSKCRFINSNDKSGTVQL